MTDISQADQASLSTSTTPAGPDSAASALARANGAIAEFIGQQVELERVQRESLETRARAVITTSGGMVTILLALAGLAAKSGTQVLPHGARDCAAAAVVGFVLSSMAAMLPSWPRRTLLVSTDSMDEALRQVGQMAEEDLARAFCAARVRHIAIARDISDRMAGLLQVALGVQLLAVALLATATFWTVLFAR
ncbi:hypothetical protein Caci_3867 [Catenulispora acidiphila DSM 44928]|uniref:Uncharacterized protein n=1 Tax=Catenulispora acidiphila (strain DSM 44928 / JCM 14897 / NBRC 102108 / NRRL B-24433 / ID139908) TaxID=479433 RepID=C7QDG7_CATAD|nr:hypothetical protein [Catenulispora acidiphila]ACU72760.1 hypothetical protein Caci_3867 [Catenulispora acidiphila DSM 44928]